MGDIQNHSSGELLQISGAKTNQTKYPSFFLFLFFLLLFYIIFLPVLFVVFFDDCRYRLSYLAMSQGVEGGEYEYRIRSYNHDG